MRCTSLPRYPNYVMTVQLLGARSTLTRWTTPSGYTLNNEAIRSRITERPRLSSSTVHPSHRAVPARGLQELVSWQSVRLYILPIGLRTHHLRGSTRQPLFIDEAAAYRYLQLLQDLFHDRVAGRLHRRFAYYRAHSPPTKYRKPTSCAPIDRKRREAASRATNVREVDVATITGAGRSPWILHSLYSVHSPKGPLT